MIRLEKVNAKNIWDVLDLKVAEAQDDFVAPNWGSICEAYVSQGTGCTAFPFAIYDNETAVGFLMIGHNEAAYDEIDSDGVPQILRNNYTLWRLMIDEKYQNKGYGREAVQLALDFIRTWPCGKAEYCVLSYEPENEVAKRLYASFGFEENGDMEDDEVVAVLKL